MHEAALASALLKLVLDEAARCEREMGRALQVTGVTVCAGLLMDVEGRALAEVFRLLAEGGPAEGAEIAVRPLPMNGSCPACGREIVTGRRAFTCPLCGESAPDWRGGRELYIESIQVRPLESAPEPIDGG